MAMGDLLPNFHLRAGLSHIGLARCEILKNFAPRHKDMGGGGAFGTKSDRNVRYNYGLG
jgi:hypothetical protein